MEENTKKEVIITVNSIFLNIREYRRKQINKYHREKELEYGGEYQKLEKYKNRVRVIDIFLVPVESLFLNLLKDTDVLVEDIIGTPDGGVKWEE